MLLQFLESSILPLMFKVFGFWACIEFG
jgi:hypothetical protein